MSLHNVKYWNKHILQTILPQILLGSWQAFSFVVISKVKESTRKKRQKTPGCRFSSFEHHITTDLLRLFPFAPSSLESYHRIYVLGSPYHVDLLYFIFSILSFFGWNMLHRLMILFRHKLNYLHHIFGKMWSDMRKERKYVYMEENQELYILKCLFLLPLSRELLHAVTLMFGLW